MKILRIERSTYTDQYGFEHQCWEVLEEVEVEPTGEYHTYEYYNETIKNPKYRDKDGRDWTAMVPTDYGCSSSWSRYIDGERVKGETWIRPYGSMYGMYPLIWKDD